MFLQNRKGGIGSFVISKSYIGQELISWILHFKSNWKNKSIVKLMTLLFRLPIIDNEDLNFIESEYSQMMMIVQNKNDADDLKKNPEKNSRAHKMVCLKFIVLLSINKTVFTAY